MAYPPLPPFCKGFFEITEDVHSRIGWWFSPYDYHKDISTWSHDADFPVRIDDDDKLRPFIACYAIEMWDKEVKRLQKVLEESDYSKSELSDTILDAKKNVLLWRSWYEEISIKK